MLKNFSTYLLTIVLLVAIIAPTYLSLVEQNYEIVIEFEEDDDLNDQKSEEEKEIKIFNIDNIAFFYHYLESKKQAIYFSKHYISHCKNLDSPPPEYYS